MGFVADLKFGNEYEQKAVEIYQRDYNGGTYKISKGNFKPYDILFECGTTIESKADRQAIKTGNIAIEFRCNGVGSGITTTLADYYYIFIHPTDDVIIIPTITLKEMIEKREYSRTVKGGDGWRSEMYLFPLMKFKKYLKKC